MAAVAALSPAGVSPAGAADQTLTAPYSSSGWNAYCQQLYVVCRADAFAWSGTGAMSVDLAAVGTQSRCFHCGATAGAFGNGAISTSHYLRERASAVHYTIAIGVERAEAQATGVGTWATAWVRVSASTSTCGYGGPCGHAEMALVVGTAAGSSAAPGDRTLELTLRSYDGQPVQPGWITLYVSLYGVVAFDEALSSGGEGLAKASLTLKRIDITIDRTAQ